MIWELSRLNVNAIFESFLFCAALVGVTERINIKPKVRGGRGEKKTEEESETNLPTPL